MQHSGSLSLFQDTAWIKTAHIMLAMLACVFLIILQLISSFISHVDDILNN